jgi:cytoskeletal protein CcmA (bactofilin family)
MFRRLRPPTEPPPPPAPPPGPPPARRLTDAVEAFDTVVGPALKVKGELSGARSLDLAGVLEGPAKVEGLCHVRRSGRITGPLRAGNVVVEGEVQGNVVARGRVELRASARVQGDIVASAVAIAEGCFFDGRIQMKGGQGAGQALSFQERRRAGPDGV